MKIIYIYGKKLPAMLENVKHNLKIVLMVSDQPLAS